LTEGVYHFIYYGLTQSIYLFIFLAVLLSMLLAVRGKPKEYMTLLQITLIGALLFFMIWETHPRYIFNFYPLVILLAASPLTDQYQRLTQRSSVGSDAK